MRLEFEVVYNSHIYHEHNEGDNSLAKESQD
jgi:hypothetical protein